MIKQSKIYLMFVCAIIVNSLSVAQITDYSKYVNPFIGTGGHGHTFPGATVPFGMVQLSPDTRIDGSWDGCSGYHYSDSMIYGFSHTHLSGTGCSDYGDIMIMPMMGNPSFDSKVYASTFSHKNEKASAGFYAVKLDDDNIDVELTSTTRVGFHKYIFNKAGKANFIIDLNHRDKLIEGEIRIVSDTVIELYRRSEAWAKDQLIYARVVFSKPVVMNAVKAEGGKMHWNTYKTKEGIVYNGNVLKMSLSATVKNGETVYVKVALSPVGVDGAKKNMEAELSHWNFEKTKKDAEALWNKELSKIQVTSADKDKLAIFYTALYHTMIQPNVAMDVDGMYRGRDNKIHKAEGFTYYSVFSLWDTFRAAHPLYTLIDQKRTADFINTFLAQYEQGGRLPVWELASNETDCMIGYHSVSVIADAMVKGIKGFDYEKAFVASKHSAMLDHLGLDAYKKNGFISMDDEHESVSKTLEYAYDDWCIAQMAEILNKKEDYNYFMKRSQSWKNIFDRETGFMRPKKNGGWLTPFEPREVNNNFTEGNSWQYSFFVPQDVYGLIEAMGGNEKFEKKLDELFSAPSQTTGREQVDITGLIGQYAHGNEPSHHMAYLYCFVGKNHKTQKRINQIMNDFYVNTPDGLIGNEDCGQMSAWYVLNALGFYQVTPGSTSFIFGTPSFDIVKIQLESGQSFVIESKNLKEENIHIQSIMLNGKKYLESAISYKDIQQGGSLLFDLGKEPKNYLENIVPSQKIWDKNIIPVPVISAQSKVFNDSLLVTITTAGKETEIMYAINEKDFIKYTKPFYINQTSTVKVFAVSSVSAIKDAENKSNTVSAKFYKRPNNWKIQINSKYNPQYTAGGDEGLIDGIHGETNWRKGEWQGYQYQNFECVIDMQKVQDISEIKTSFLQDSRSWILFPKEVVCYGSVDGKNYTELGKVFHGIKWDDYKVQVLEFSAEFSKTKARYIKIKAYNFGKLPQDHQGAGDGAFIFIDEIEIK
jgi:predicted alpha-1,2-mannosidase